MPTDSDKRDAAVKELKLTNVGWLKSGGSLRYPGGTAPMSTHWGKAMQILASIGVSDPSPTIGGRGIVSYAELALVTVPPILQPPDPATVLLPLRGST